MRQDRFGYRKRRFAMYKFRTMSVDAEKRQAALEPLNEAAGPVFKLKADPRLTRIGPLLRRTSIENFRVFISCDGSSPTNRCRSMTRNGSLKNCSRFSRVNTTVGDGDA